MTNESYIIVGYCQSILMNLSFHKKKLGGLAPSGNYGRYAYVLEIIMILLFIRIQLCQTSKGEQCDERVSNKQSSWRMRCVAN